MASYIFLGMYFSFLSRSILLSNGLIYAIATLLLVTKIMYSCAYCISNKRKAGWFFEEDVEGVEGDCNMWYVLGISIFTLLSVFLRAFVLH